MPAQLNVVLSSEAHPDLIVNDSREVECGAKTPVAAETTDRARYWAVREGKLAVSALVEYAFRGVAATHSSRPRLKAQDGCFASAEGLGIGKEARACDISLAKPRGRAIMDPTGGGWACCPPRWLRDGFEPDI